MFGWEIKGRKKRMVELAGMIKEVGSGTMDKLNEIMAKFAVKVGVREEIVFGYLELFIKAKLVIIQHGEETWKYNVDEEMDIFQVNI